MTAMSVSRHIDVPPLDITTTDGDRLRVTCMDEVLTFAGYYTVLVEGFLIHKDGELSTSRVAERFGGWYGPPLTDLHPALLALCAGPEAMRPLLETP